MFIGSEDKVLLRNAKHSRLIYILKFLSNFNCYYCILTLHTHIFDRIGCICIPWYTASLMMTL
jgi:hypothetical protein